MALSRTIELKHRGRTIDANVSFVMDLTRFSLAFAVAAGHWTQPFFQEGWVDLTPMAFAAVGGFFVLSGFTIRMLNPTGSFALTRYGIDRISRLWSVALPALLITGLLDFTSYCINDRYYIDHWGDSIDHPIFRFLVNSVFLSQIWGHNVSPLSNSPYWSLSYEAIFYILFGFFMARRIIPMLIAAIIAGPNILYLMILWLMGVAAFEIFDRSHTPKRSVVLCVSSAFTAIVLCLILSTRFADVKYILDICKNRYFGVFNTSLGMVNNTFVIAALLFAPILLSLLSGARLLGSFMTVSTPIVRLSRRIGDFTFPLYLFHFPLFVLCGSIGFYDRHSAVQKIGVFTGVCCLIFLITPLTTTFKNQLRQVLQRGIGTFSASKVSVRPGSSKIG